MAQYLEQFNYTLTSSSLPYAINNGSPYFDDGSVDVIVDNTADQLEDRLASNIASGTGSLNKAVRGTYGLRRSGR
jgi:hypothetical protein